MTRLSLAARTLLPALALGWAQTTWAAQPDAPAPAPAAPAPAEGPVYVPPAPREVAPPAPAATGNLAPSPGYNNYREIPVFVPYSAREYVDPKDKTKGESLLESYFKPKFPPNTDPLHRTHRPAWAPGGDIDTGMRVGSPYYWSNHSYPLYGAGPVPGPMTAGYGYSAGATPWVAPSGVTQTGCNCNRGSGSAFAAPTPVPVPMGTPPAPYSTDAFSSWSGGLQPTPAAPYNGVPTATGSYTTGPYATGTSATGNGSGQYPPGTYAGGFASDPYAYHFGPGFHRHSDHAHYRFPYYTYRSPWYHPGHASYNRDTNFPW